MNYWNCPWTNQLRWITINKKQQTQTPKPRYETKDSFLLMTFIQPNYLWQTTLYIEILNPTQKSSRASLLYRQFIVILKKMMKFFTLYKKTSILHRCLREHPYYIGNLVLFWRKWWNFLSYFLSILVWILNGILLLF